MTKQDILDCFSDINYAYNNCNKHDDLSRMLDELIETQSRWIPVSERLPEVGSEVLVCYEFKKKRYVYIANFYGDGEFHGYDDEYLTTEGRKYRKAVAWMPLPEPYREMIEQEPKVGEWLEKEVNSDKVIEEWQSARCSVCDRYHTTPYMYYFSHYDYCPHCGTKMERRQRLDQRRSKRNSRNIHHTE